MNEVEKLGRLIRASRKKAGWWQAELAEKCGVATDSVAKWERGEREPGAVKLIKMTRLFNWSVADLLQVLGDSMPYILRR